MPPTADKAISFAVAAAPPVGQTLDQLLAGMSANTWAPFTMGGLTPSLVQPGDSPVDTYFNRGFWDHINKKIVAICQAHGSTNDSRELEWSDATNMWSPGPTPPVPNQGVSHGYSLSTYDPNTGDRYFHEYFSRRQFRKLFGGSWGLVANDARGSSTYSACVEFHPTLGSQGAVIVADVYGVSRWDRASNVSTSLHGGFVDGLSGGGGTSVWDPDTQSVFFGGGATEGPSPNGPIGWWQVDSAGVLTRRANLPSSVGVQGSAGQSNGNLIAGFAGKKPCIMEANGNIREYTLATNSWGSVISTRAYAPNVTSNLHWCTTIPEKGCTVCVYDTNGGTGRAAYVWKR